MKNKENLEIPVNKKKLGLFKVDKRTQIYFGN